MHDDDQHGKNDDDFFVLVLQDLSIEEANVDCE
jgi:hypothetical protein